MLLNKVRLKSGGKCCWGQLAACSLASVKLGGVGSKCLKDGLPVTYKEERLSLYSKYELKGCVKAISPYRLSLGRRVQNRLDREERVYYVDLLERQESIVMDVQRGGAAYEAIAPFACATHGGTVCADGSAATAGAYEDSRGASWDFLGP